MHMKMIYTEWIEEWNDYYKIQQHPSELFVKIVYQVSLKK